MKPIDTLYNFIHDYKDAAYRTSPLASILILYIDALYLYHGYSKGQLKRFNARFSMKASADQQLCAFLKKGHSLTFDILEYEAIRHTIEHKKKHMDDFGENLGRILYRVQGDMPPLEYLTLEKYYKMIIAE